MAERLTKWSVTTGTVIRHMHYGVRVQVPSGEIGVIDRVHIDDNYVKPASWPTIGSVITVVGAGYAGSQLRLSSRPSHLNEARARMAGGHDATTEAGTEDFGPNPGVHSS
ncbi:hypothetical protein SNE510_68610 [Streptomyces sp. NE5-10]|uniref:hypothetical protein n=1 Tax=Streptomyces sp. NE5-10 TaxID=2759674 RepID=UPI00190900E4|nr:hypothetical protein [Streptomyces sp. NE5-10]GHJ97342.1 hypothetical protein SNE510_68610 [Streptomyces sp. NE5-10]